MMEGTVQLVGVGMACTLHFSHSALWGARLHPPSRPPSPPPHRLHHLCTFMCQPHHSSVPRVSAQAFSSPPPLPCSAALYELLARTPFPSGVFSSPCQISSTTISKRLRMGIITFRTPGRWVCFGGGKRPGRPRVWKTRQRRGTINKSQKLLERVRSLSNVKEEVYGALDTFIAWEVEFPLITVKKALKTLRLERDWKRIIQISKWMIGKGQGKTLGTYLLLLEALDEEGRIEEAQELWQKVFTVHMECTPRNFFSRMISMYYRHGMLEEVLEVFADMEELDVRPDTASVDKITLTYEKLGDLDKAERVKKKYPAPKWRYRTINGKPIRFRTTTQNDHQSSARDVDVADETYLRGNSRDEDLSRTSGEENFADTEGEEEEEFADYEGEEEEEFGRDNHYCAPRQATVDAVQFVQ